MGQSASVVSTPATTASEHPKLAQCPMQHDTSPSATSPAARCPIPHDAPPASPPKAAEAPAKCPIPHDTTLINPANQMPNLSQSRALNQAVDLPTERTASSIPRDENDTWDYPSPQQFYNALVRKGWETPEEHVEMMVGIHNFLNEQAWQEVLKWEQRWNPGVQGLQLARFQGKPGELSPKARLYLLAGWLLPSKFNNEPPFDRHDWIIRRPTTGEEVRYVIDYYSAPPESDGSPVFSLDVRPALDSFGGIAQRVGAATAETWNSFKSDKSTGL